MGDKHTLLDFLFNKVITYLTYLMCELECDRERGEREREREERDKFVPNCARVRNRLRRVCTTIIVNTYVSENW